MFRSVRYIQGATYSVKSHGPNRAGGLTKYDFTVTLVGRGKAGL